MKFLKRSKKKVVAKKRKDNVIACEKCGGNRWKTNLKGRFYQCRKCKTVRRDEDQDKPKNIEQEYPQPINLEDDYFAHITRDNLTDHQ